MRYSNCVVCGSTNFETLYDSMYDFEYGVPSTGINIIQCSQCQLVMLHPMPHQEALSAFYPDDYANVHGEESRLRKYLIESAYNQVYKYIKKLVSSTATILDVGCSSGHFMEHLSLMEPGWTFTGVEINKTAVEEGLRLGRKNILHGAFEDVAFSPASFDLIYSSHVVEHVLQPKFLLEKAYNLLKPGGRLLVETPNTRSLDFRLFGKYWGGLHYPRHTYLFSEDNVTRLLREIGFSKVTVTTTYDVFGWALSIQNILSDRFKIKKTNGRMPFYSILMLVVLPVVILQKITGASPAMRVTAYKD